MVNKRDLLKVINLYFQIFQIHKIRQQIPNSLSDPMNTLNNILKFAKSLPKHF